jgi:hypothetical protein
MATPMHLGIKRAGELQIAKIQHSLDTYGSGRHLPFKIGVTYVFPDWTNSVSIRPGTACT